MEEVTKEAAARAAKALGENKQGQFFWGHIYALAYRQSVRDIKHILGESETKGVKIKVLQKPAATFKTRFLLCGAAGLVTLLAATVALRHWNWIKQTKGSPTAEIMLDTDQEISE